MKVQVVRHGPAKSWPALLDGDALVLCADNWDDFHYRTTFDVLFHSVGRAKVLELGSVKIGYKGQSANSDTYDDIPKEFNLLSDSYFSLGASRSYYQELMKLSKEERDAILTALRDMAFDSAIEKDNIAEPVLAISLLRHASSGKEGEVIELEYRRILAGKAFLTKFQFGFEHVFSSGSGVVDDALTLNFIVEPNSSPPSNMHAMIGRNGSGKTSILNAMADSIFRPENTNSRFIQDGFSPGVSLGEDYFGDMVSVSFSAFDSFVAPQRQSSKASDYHYVGLQSEHFAEDALVTLKTAEIRKSELFTSVCRCVENPAKRPLWERAMKSLSVDVNFHNLNVAGLADCSNREIEGEFNELFENLSSGHAIVLHILSKLVEHVSERTLVLIDEPESHLHPPLLSAFMRALSELLIDRNALAIIATHSPVVLQEMPKSCVWKLNRSGREVMARRPRIETFGENVGILTHEVFSLEAEQSGFYATLTKEVESGLDYQQIWTKYNGQLGLEAVALINALVRSGRPSSQKGDGKEESGE